MSLTEIAPERLSANSSVERVRHPEIWPLEVGDLWVDEAVFREQICDRGLTLALRRAIELLQAGRGATRSNGPLPSVVSGFEAIFLAGGRARPEELSQGLSSSSWAVVFGNGAFTGVRGGFVLLQRRRLSGWVLDLGQSQLKIATEERLWTFPRDPKRLRAANQVTPSELPAQRRRLREFIALSLQLALAEARRRPEALVFALPARLADDGTPQCGDYAGMRNDRALLRDCLELAGLSGTPVLLVNDAELAAFSAWADPRLAAFRKILVLTLGFGIGAALVCRTA